MIDRIVMERRDDNTWTWSVSTEHGVHRHSNVGYDWSMALACMQSALDEYEGYHGSGNVVEVELDGCGPGCDPVVVRMRKPVQLRVVQGGKV